jgi:ribosomal protein S17
VSYVLEVNPNSGIEEGDTLDIEETEPVMKVLF